MSFIDRLCNGYAAIVKYFSLFFSTIFLIVTIILFCDAITLPHHSEFKPEFVAKSFEPVKNELNNTDYINNIFDGNCRGISIQKDIEKSYMYDITVEDFKNVPDEENKVTRMKFSASCLARLYDIYGVQGFDEWYTYFQEAKKEMKYEYYNSALAIQTMKQYQRARAEHDAAERDLSWSYYQLGIAGGFFMAFVLSSLLLLLVRIESNTRRNIE
jgi:hypothetical protein